MLLRAVLALAVFALVGSWSGRARAYPWMIRHDYTACVQCHADPSGGGLLTEYGRAQSEVLLRSHYTKQSGDEEPGAVAGFFFGAVKLPEQLLLGGDYRLAYFRNTLGDTPATDRLIQMQADLQGQLTVDRFRVNASLGYDHTGAEAAQITTRTQDNLISRVHWLGLDLGEDKQFLLRAGRMNVPFGVRSVEHTMFIRSPPGVPGGGVRDDLNTGQQHGVALSYNTEGMRGELMLIAGNYQINPDDFRERGYSGYFELAPSPKIAVGLSSLITYSKNDVFFQTPLIRHAHGAFARWTPIKQLVLTGEGDFLYASQKADRVPVGQANNHGGFASMVQADLEFWQGLHFMLTGEATLPPVNGGATSFGGWASVNWFFLPHVDLRTDFIKQSLALGSTNLDSTTLLVQFHAFL